MAGTIIADRLEAASTSQLVIENGVAETPPTIVDVNGTQVGTFCRAWVNFDGTGTFSPNPSTTKIRGSFNVSSITDNGTCDYTVNFTNAMPDVNYSIVGGTTGTGVSASLYPQPIAAKRQTDMLVSSCRIWALTGASGGSLSLNDAEVVNVSVFR